MDITTNLKIAHSIASMDIRAGGTTSAVLDILKEQSKFADLELYTLSSAHQIDIDIERLKLFSETALIRDYSFELQKKLKESSADIFHCHALWNLTMHQMAAKARKLKKKYIISVHGMLHPWAINNKGFKKKIALSLYQQADLNMADCLHATSAFEAQYIQQSGYLNPIAVIPNGINLKDYPLRKDSIANTNKRKLLFLSRIHFEKGYVVVLFAWSKIPEVLRADWEMEIVGSGDRDYLESLQIKIKNLNLQSQIKITGPKYGKEKIQIYHSSDLFILPSYSENFGMVVAEALSCGIPVITTKGTPWKDLEDSNAGSWIDLGIIPLQETLKQYLQKDRSELKQMGINGRKLVEEKYSIESVGTKFKELYYWMLNKNRKPNFIV